MNREGGSERNAVAHEQDSHVFDVTAATQTRGNMERNVTMFLREEGSYFT
jgi:hypothetical protein